MKIAAEQIIYIMHHPQQVNGMRTTIGMVPKKCGGPLSLRLASEGWGLRGQQGFSAQKVINWIGAMTAFSLVFAGLWLSFVAKTDLQNAFMPYMILTTMLLLALGVPQVLDVVD
jgi:hypothetical protein